MFHKRSTRPFAIGALSLLALMLCLASGCGSDEPPVAEPPAAPVPPSVPVPASEANPEADPEDSVSLSPQPAATTELASDEPELASDEPELDSQDVTADVEPATPAVTVRFASLEQVQEHIQSLGKPAVVDYWSLACEPCMEAFPELVELSRQHEDDIACIAVDVDFDGRKSKPPQAYQEPVETFLAEQQATFTNFICTTPNEQVYGDLEIASIPTVIVYGADGKVAKKFVDAGETAGFTYEKDVIPYVKQLIGKG